MPVEKGIIYSDYNGSTKEGHGITTDEIARTLVVNSDDVSTLGMSDKVNGLSRYRPVHWDKPALNMTMVTTQHHNNIYWNEVAPSDTPWMYGAGYDNGYRAIEAPKIDMTFDKLVDADGNINASTKWIFRRPEANDYKNMNMFHGYNHNAKASISAYIAGGRWVTDEQGKQVNELSYRLGTLYMGVNASASPTNSYYALRKEDGCWSPSELLKIVGITSGYICAVIKHEGGYIMASLYQISLGTGTSYPRGIDIMNNHGQVSEFMRRLYVRLNVNNNTANLAVQDSQISLNGKCQIYLFHSDEYIGTTVSTTPPRVKGTSLYIDDSNKPLHTFQMVYSTATQIDKYVNVWWSLSEPYFKQPLQTLNLDRYLYIQYGSSVYAVDRLYMGLKTPKGYQAGLSSTDANDDFEGGVQVSREPANFRIGHYYDGIELYSQAVGRELDLLDLDVGYFINDVAGGYTTWYWRTGRLSEYLKEVLGWTNTQVTDFAGYYPTDFPGRWRGSLADLGQFAPVSGTPTAQAPSDQDLFNAIDRGLTRESTDYNSIKLEVTVGTNVVDVDQEFVYIHYNINQTYNGLESDREL